MGEKFRFRGENLTRCYRCFGMLPHMRSSLPFAEQAPALTGWQVVGNLTRTFVAWTAAFGSVIAVGYLLR